MRNNLLIFFILSVLLSTLFFLSKRESPGKASTDISSADKTLTPADESLNPDNREVDKVRLLRKLDLSIQEAERKGRRITNPGAIDYSANNYVALEEGYGNTPAMTSEDLSQSIQLENAAKAAQNPLENASQLSLLAKAANFDRNLYKSSTQYREEYLSKAEPARVYQGDDNSVFKLKRHSPYYQEVNQGESVFITVQGEPNMPISLTSLDLGKLGNGLTHQTIEADGSGTATFEFFGMPGTIADTKLLCSSPTCKGQLKFIINTKLKRAQ